MEIIEGAGRPAWQDRLLSVAGYSLLAGVEACIASMSWAGLTGWARESLHLADWQALAVPVALDGAAGAAATLALRSVIRGESAAGARLMLGAFTLGSALLNWHHAVAAYADSAAPAFFAAMSVAVVVMFELVLRELRRASLRVVGAVEAPLPRFRPLRWLVFGRETWAAWAGALRYGYRTPAEALARVWESHESQVALVRVEAPQALDGLSKRELARAALVATRGEDPWVPAALAWLSERGQRVDRSYAYEVAKEIDAEQRRLSAAPAVA